MALSDIDDLVGNPNNPRKKLSAQAKKGLRLSLEKFGDLSGITFNTRTGRLVCGHQRMDQLKALGATFDGGTVVLKDGQRFPVRVVDWDPEMEAQANVAANNPQIQGEWSDGIGDFLTDIRLHMDAVEFDDLGFADLAETLALDFAVGDAEMPDLPTDDEVNFCTMTLTLTIDGRDQVQAAAEKAIGEVPGGKSPVGMAVAEICRRYLNG